MSKRRLRVINNRILALRKNDGLKEARRVYAIKLSVQYVSELASWS